MDIPALSTVTATGVAAPRPTPTASTAPPAGASPTTVSNVTAQTAPAASETQASRQELDQAVKDVNDFVGAVNADLRFSVDDDTGRTVVKVIDNATKEVIKQFPSKEILALAKALDGIKGLLVKQSV